MKYIIIGAGGTGGILGFYMTKAGKDVTLIARNAHLEAMKKQGLSVQKMWTNETETIPVSAESMESYEAKGEKSSSVLKNILSIPAFHLFKTFPMKIR